MYLVHRLEKLEEEYTELTEGRNLVDYQNLTYSFDDGTRARGLGAAVAEAERQVNRIKKQLGK